MIKQITKDIIIDLLPLYLADEASADTRTLVEQYLQTDPEIAKLVEKSKNINFVENSPLPLVQEDKLKAYRQAKRLIILRTVILAILIALIFYALLALGFLVDIQPF